MEGHALHANAMNRRAFLKAAGLAAVAWRAGAQQAQGQVPKRSTLVMPSAYFGTCTLSEAGLRADVAPRIVDYLDAQVRAGEIPGACVAGVRRGKVFIEHAVGTFCDRTRRLAPYDGAAVHPLHSISKMVSATAVVMAWQNGLIDIDLPVIEYIPEFGVGGKEGITIRQLLSHSAGIPISPKQQSTHTEADWKASVAAICAEPVQWPPGSRTKYHGLSGLLISAEAVRRARKGKTWNQICQADIFDPLGLTSFTFEFPPGDLPLACIPRLSDPPRQWQSQIDHFAGQPAAGLKGGFTDLLKFLAFHCHKGVWDGKPLLKESYWSAMHAFQFPGKPPSEFESWGLGMMVRGDRPRGDGWFGIPNVPRPHIFSHVGTDIAMAIGDPDTDIQIAFIVTDSPKTPVKATELRTTVSGIVFNGIDS